MSICFAFEKAVARMKEQQEVEPAMSETASSSGEVRKQDVKTAKATRRAAVLRSKRTAERQQEFERLGVPYQKGKQLKRIEENTTDIKATTTRIEETTTDIKADTTDIKADTTVIKSQLEEIKQALARPSVSDDADLNQQIAEQQSIKADAQANICKLRAEAAKVKQNQKEEKQKAKEDEQAKKQKAKEDEKERKQKAKEDEQDRKRKAKEEQTQAKKRVKRGNPVNTLIDYLGAAPEIGYTELEDIINKFGLDDLIEKNEQVLQQFFDTRLQAFNHILEREGYKAEEQD